MKTRYVLLILLIAAGHTAYCQGGEDDRSFGRVYFGLSFTPEVSYNYLVNNYVPMGSTSSANQSAVSTENHQSSPDFGANATFKIGINLTHWLAIESGIGYTLAQFRYSGTQPLAYTSPLIPAAADTVNVKETVTYHYMTVPVGLRFSIGHRAVRGVIATGVDFDFLLRQREEDTYTTDLGVTSSTVTNYETHNFRTFNVSPFLGLGMDCYFSHHVALRLMPVAQIQSIKNIDQPISQYLWNVGFNVALLFGGL